MRKPGLILLITILIIMSLLTACGKKEQTQSKPDGEKELKAALEDSKVVPMEGEELEPGEEVSNLLLEKIKIEKVEEKEASVVLKITYPDLGSELVRLTADKVNTQEEADGTMLELLALLKEDKISYVTEEIEVEYSEESQDGLLWTEQLQNAMSGGLYNVIMEQ